LSLTLTATLPLEITFEIQSHQVGEKPFIRRTC
jgi:hypothetical protein